ncbi:hypothetical protein OBBRIDRAFT_792000 [Obba rivulosa]|uniref:HMG box domain-containing protein n=1 Tax=Obba rivulosa TaxID=1052685 RepID=A0A8E2B136_9APHY|nr:hypothetical protein OBBRIDRAFT_792000 [Obba rivulosa]
MLSLLTQRLALRASPFPVTAGVRARVLPVTMSLTRTLITPSRVAFAAAKTGATDDVKPKKTLRKTAATAEKKATNTKKTAAKATKPKKTESKKAVPKPKKKAPEPKLTLLTIKVPKDKQPPKRPTSPYFIFLAERRKQLSLKATSMTEAQEISRRLAQEWKALSDEQKQLYIERHQALLPEYEKALKEYADNTDPTLIKAWDKQRKAKGKFGVPADARPRAEPTGYAKFVREFFKTYTPSGDFNSAIMKSQATMTAAAARWRSMSAEEKARYNH